MEQVPSNFTVLLLSTLRSLKTITVPSFLSPVDEKVMECSKLKFAMIKNVIVLDNVINQLSPCDSKTNNLPFCLNRLVQFSNESALTIMRVCFKGVGAE